MHNLTPADAKPARLISTLCSIVHYKEIVRFVQKWHSNAYSISGLLEAAVAAQK